MCFEISLKRSDVFRVSQYERQGSSFHFVGAIAENARSPAVFNLVFGMSSRFWLAERREHSLFSGLSNCFKYKGPFPKSTLNVITAIL